MEETKPQPTEQGQPPHTNDFPVVGLGASAGGLKALIQFFELMPASSGMAFVVILHLSPKHESHSPDLLQNVTKMLVTQVNETVRVEPNRVYVIPPTKHLAMTDGMISLSEPKDTRTQHVAVDLFFRTLAESKRDRAIGIVLSGSGSDGSVGLKRLKEQGGVTLAQSPEDAEYDGMPRHAIGTGVVDFVLPVAEMPEKLVQLWQNASVIKLPASEEQIRLVDPSIAAEDALREILNILRSRTGHDFTHYKRATVLRRIERRLQVNQQPDLPAYSKFLREHQEEARALLKDMLISVTNFFRDRASFDALEREVIPRLFQGKTPDDQVRVWVAGCATGEEAYSIAMLLSEYAAGLANPPGIQVFATDIDEDMLARARDGNYPNSIIADIAPTRLRNFFTQEGDHYVVKKSVREKVLFAAHNVLKDPPFSRLDLVACRNLLIYLNRDVQEQILELFHFTLRPGGYMFLGGSESADATPKLFVTLDKKSRIYKANVISRTALRVPTLPLGTPGAKPLVRVQTTGEQQPVSFGELHQRLLEQYAPPSVIINHNYDIVHLSDRAGRFLQFAGGEPSHNLLRVVHPELRLDLRTALFQAVQSGKSVEARRVRLNREGHTFYVNMIARPVPGDEEQAGFILVIFDEVEEILGSDGNEPPTKETESVVTYLEQELHRTKEQLQATIEQSETANEEMKASNEELQAINEELRSASEELETSKEELQSINEELTTVNYELKSKVDQVNAINDDLKNLISSTEIATIFLDRALRIRRYTPRALDIFNLIQTDVGRPLSDITQRLNYEWLVEDAAQVFDTLRPVEHEVAGADGRWYIARVVPYRTLDDHIDGAVLAFIDVTERKRVEEALRESEARLQELLSLVPAGIYRCDAEGRITDFNQCAANFWGREPQIGEEEEKFCGSFRLWRPDGSLLPHEETPMAHAVREGKSVRNMEVVIEQPTGNRLIVSVNIDPILDESGKILGAVNVFLDITERKRAEDKLRESEEHKRLLIESAKDYAIITLDAERRVTSWNTGAEVMYGYTAEEIIGQLGDILLTPEDRAHGVQEKETELALTTGRAADERWHLRKDGSRFYVSGVMSALLGEKLSGYVKVARDLTERKQTDEQLHQAREKLETAVQERTQELSTANESLVHEVGERTAAETRVKELLRRVISAQEDERQRISRELHDHLGQLLTALQLNLASLTKRNVKSGDLRTGVTQAQDVAKQIDAGLDFLIWELRPAALEDLGLPAAIANFTAEWSKHFGIPAEFHSRGLDHRRFTPEIEINLYRIAQEALNNVAKHAQAGRVDVLIERREQDLVLIIEDDGVGFDFQQQQQQQQPPPNERGRGLGLLSMRERAALVGGTMEIESAPGSGTTIFVRVPLPTAT